MSTAVRCGRRPEQEALIHAAPGIIGDLGGIAYRAPDEAIRIVLDQAIKAAKRSRLDKSEQVEADGTAYGDDQ